ncbi:MAG: endonuclease MutS2 [Bacillota bacterium]|nr:endonuclease MutS2 [Bacillota bacterium]
MNEKTLKKLEYNKIINMLMAECSSSLGKDLAAELLPVRDLSLAKTRQKETTEARDILISNPGFSLGGIRNVRDAVNLAQKNGILDCSRLLDIMSTSKAGKRLKLTITQLKGNYPILRGLAEGINFVNSLETAIEDAIGDDGQMLDSASSELYGIRRKMRTANDRIKDKLDSLIHNPNHAKHLQDALITIRNDRYVVPVRQEYRNEVPGLIHDQSASGATLFIEPMAVLELNNDLKRLRGAEEEEINRILIKLSGLVMENARELKENLDILAAMDLIFAKGHLSLKWDAFEPKLNNEGEITLRKARHPLLGDSAVPIDFTMSPNLAGIIITGPNTGGKTVSLKIAGLFVLMAQAGLHLPTADRCNVGVFRGVYADIGDEQSIEQSLSTFSSHMTNIVDILAKAGKNNLVVLDELGAGTDPVEGAALAMAIIDTLLAKGSKVIVTTHYSELKAYAYNHVELANASVEFDIDTLRPTYRLLMGIPGRSNAFDIALSLGVNTNVIAKADEYMSKEAKEVANFLANLEEGRVETERAKAEAKELKQRLEALELEMKGREEALRLRESQLLEKARERADRLVRERRREADSLVRELKSLVSQENAKHKETLLREARTKVKKLDSLAPEYQEPQYPGKALSKAEVGDEVYVPRLRKNALVVNIVSDKEVQIQAGIMKVNMKLKDLRTVTNSEAEQAKNRYGSISASKAKNIKSEIDLRGLTGEEARMELEKYIDDAAISNIGTIRIIHGLGTGVLKKMVYDLLKHHPRVKSQRLGGYYEGGAGVTIAELQ